MVRGSMTFRNQRSVISPGELLPTAGACGRGLKIAVLSVLLVACAGLPAGAVKDHQPTTRIVSGTVYDTAGNAVAGATVELTDLQTGKVLDIYSQGDGEYQYSDMRFDHDYTIKAMFKDASSEARKISLFETRWHLVMNLTVSKPAK